MVIERQVACLYRLTAASRKVALDMSKPASARVGRQPMIGTRGFSTAATLREGTNQMEARILKKRPTGMPPQHASVGAGYVYTHSRMRDTHECL